MDIEPALIAHLLNDQDVSYHVHNRVFMLAIPQDKAPPAIVIQRISTPRTLGLVKPMASNPRIQVSCYADRYDNAKEIADKVDKSLDYFAGMLGGETKARVYRADYRENYEQETGLYRADVDFFVMHK